MRRNIMKNTKRFSLVILLSLIFLFTQCGLFFNTSSVVEINLGTGPVPPDGSGSFKPDVITGGTLTVSLPETDDIVKSFSKDDDSIRMVVPSGRHRKIELEINLDPTLANNPTAVLSFMGTAYVDLAPNEVKNVSLKMIPGRTRLVVPDFGKDRVVQFNDALDGSGFDEYLPLDTSGAAGLVPYDLDLDARGNVYIGYFYDAAVPPYYFIAKTDRITGSSKTLIPVGQSVSALGIDKYNNLLYYYSTGNQIFRIDLNTADVTTAIPVSIPLPVGYTTIYAIDVDREGYVYILSGATSTFAAKVNPKTGGIMAELTGSPLAIPTDMVVKEGLLYISNTGNGTANYEILVLRTSDMSLYNNAGSRHTGNPPLLEGEFFGPRRFVGTTNKPFYIMDEGQYGMVAVLYANYIIKFNDLGWLPWTVFNAGQTPYLCTFFSGG